MIRYDKMLFYRALDIVPNLPHGTKKLKVEKRCSDVSVTVREIRVGNKIKPLRNA